MKVKYLNYLLASNYILLNFVNNSLNQIKEQERKIPLRMKKLISFTIFLMSVTCLFGQSDEATAKALLGRIAPSFNEKVVFKKKPQVHDFFELYSLKNGKLLITANNANSMAVGLNYFLKNYCQTAVSWYADDSVSLPEKFPNVPTKIRKEARTPNRFFLNYCTFGYTMPWWQWRDWERFIDWMALNGVNLPLAITGQEKIWLNVWKKFGLSDDDIRSFFTGPAYLPWHRMANIDRWEGPLPNSWIDHQAELQKKILARERSFDMKPVLPAFAGHVPQKLAAKYPTSKITSLGEWGGFSKEYQSYFLDSFDPLFRQIQKAFLEEQTKIYGTDHLYGLDPFNEVTPPSWELAYLADVSKNIYESLRENDEQAQWLQMTWIFYFNQEKWTNERIKAYLKAVPQNKLLLLDYFCDRTEIWKKTDAYYGQPYIWCYLGNFGGNTVLDGNMKDVDEKIEQVFQNGGKNLWGIGSTLEGFGNNPIMYEYVFDKAWNATNYNDFALQYADSRLGKADENYRKAWQILSEKIYNHSSDVGRGDLTNSKPVFEGHFNWTVNPEITYDNRDLLEVWNLMLQNKNNSALYRNDLTSVGKQVLGNYFPILRDRFTQAYRAKNLQQMKWYGNKMLELIDDIDRLLAANPNTLVGKWIDDAQKFAADEKEKLYYATDARKIITVWGEEGHDLNDYANRSIAGLMKDYYGGRWKIFIDESCQAIESGKAMDEKEVLKKVDHFSEVWAEKNTSYSPKPVGNLYEISLKLYEKYSPLIETNL